MRTWMIVASVIADLIDLTGIGQLAIPIDIAVITLHLIYAGPRALIGIVDMIPVVGFLPIYTGLALSYDESH